MTNHEKQTLMDLLHKAYSHCPNQNDKGKILDAYAIVGKMNQTQNFQQCRKFTLPGYFE